MNLFSSYKTQDNSDQRLDYMMFTKDGANFIIGEGTTEVDMSAFPEEVVSIVFPSTLQTLKVSGNTNLENLATVDFSKVSHLKVIPKECFEYAESLRQIIFPLGVEKIEEDALYGCSSLECIVIPPTVNTIEEFFYEEGAKIILFCPCPIDVDGFINLERNYIYVAPEHRDVYVMRFKMAEIELSLGEIPLIYIGIYKKEPLMSLSQTETSLAQIPSRLPAFYAMLNGRQEGPLESEVFISLINRNVVNSNTLVWTAGMPQWECAYNIPSLQHLFQGRIPPPAF